MRQLDRRLTDFEDTGPLSRRCVVLHGRSSSIGTGRPTACLCKSAPLQLLVSGIMGLAFSAIFSMRIVPFWQGLIADRRPGGELLADALPRGQVSFWPLGLSGITAQGNNVKVAAGNWNN
ncbi:hypothetical protein B0H15DRAFT_1019451 [Mycena belliarum]|uniref:Uncharacterized protein n=1 Tax=Mycena belliarum TaxID=1033014 RepID=A0AAD6UFE8_9AGAR|nr:hypothetical protein B0H15DRAFT_1019451 [Mycena belliae]